MKSLEDKIKTFMLRVLQNNYDYVLPVERKGVGLLKLVRDSLDFTNSIISLDAALRAQDEYLKGRRILVLDDTVMRGRMLKYVVDQLESLPISTRPKEVHAAAIAVHQECPKERWPKYAIGTFTDDEYASLKSEIIKLLLSIGEPLDIDHITFQLELDPFSIQDFGEFLAHFGTVFKIPYPEDQDLQVITLDEPLFANEDFFQFLPPEIPVEGACKIRFYIHIPDRRIFCIPIVYHAIPINHHISKNQCTLLSEGVIPLCECLNNSKEMSKQCFKCISLVSAFKLGATFYHLLQHTLSKMNLRLSYLGINRDNLYFLYPECASEIEHIINDKFHSANFEASNKAITINRTPSGCQMELPITFESTFAPPIRILMEIYRGWKSMREEAIKQGEIKPNQLIDDIGLSWTQIRQRTLSFVSSGDMSQSMDILLDQGTIAPLIRKVKASLIGYPYAPEVWIRAYRCGGEHVERELQAFSRFLKGEFL